MKRQELKTILAKHKEWLETDGHEGEKAVLANHKIENIDDLLKGADLRKADLQNANFSGSNLSKANLIEANLKGSILIETNLSKAKLNDAKFANANLTNANLSEAFGSDADFFNATLVGANFTKAKFNQADFRKARFEYSDLSDGKLQRASFNEAQISDCKLVNTDLEQADLKEAHFDNVDFTQATLFEVNFQESTLSDSNFKLTYLRTANLMGCKIINSDFEKSNFESADMFGAKFEDCNFTSAKLNRANMLKVTLVKSCFENAKLSFLIVNESTLENFSDEIREKFERTWDVRDAEGKPISNYSIIHTVELPQEYRQIGIQILGQLGYILQDRYKDKISKFNLEQDGLKVTMVVETKKEHSESVEETIEDFGKVVSGTMMIEEFTQNDFQRRDIKNLLEHMTLQQKLNHTELQGKVDELLLVSGRSPSDKWREFFSEDFKFTITPVPGGGGLLFFNDTKVSVGNVEYNLVNAMVKRLLRDWQNGIDTKPTDAGWLSVDEFVGAVASWKDNISKMSTDITKVLRRLESKVAKAIDEKNLKNILIENGRPFGFAKHYRIAIHPSLISSEE